MDEVDCLTINKEYAEKYVKRKQAEELSKRENALDLHLLSFIDCTASLELKVYVLYIICYNSLPV